MLVVWTTGGTYWYVCEKKGLCSEVRQELDKLADISRRHLVEIEAANNGSTQSSVLPSFNISKAKESPKKLDAPKPLNTTGIANIPASKTENELPDFTESQISLDELISNVEPPVDYDKIAAEKAAEAELAKIELGKAELAKAERVKAELAKAERVKAEALAMEEALAMLECEKEERAEEERAKSELAKAERAKEELAKAENEKEELAKAELERAELAIAEKKKAAKAKEELAHNNKAKAEAAKTINTTSKTSTANVKGEGFYAIVGMFGDKTKAMDRIESLKHKNVKGTLLPHVAGLSKVAIYLDENAERAAEKLVDIRKNIYGSSQLFYYNPNK